MATTYLCTKLRFPKNPSGKKYSAEESKKAYDYLFAKGSGYKSILEDILWRPFANQFTFNTAEKGLCTPAKNEDGYVLPDIPPDCKLYEVLQEYNYPPSVYQPGEYEELTLNWSSGSYYDSYMFLLLLLFGDNVTDFIISQLKEYARFAFLPSEPIHHERKKRPDMKPANRKQNMQFKAVTLSREVSTKPTNSEPALKEELNQVIVEQESLQKLPVSSIDSDISEAELFKIAQAGLDALAEDSITDSQINTTNYPEFK